MRRGRFLHAEDVSKFVYCIQFLRKLQLPVGVSVVTLSVAWALHFCSALQVTANKMLKKFKT